MHWFSDDHWFTPIWLMIGFFAIGFMVAAGAI